MTITKKDLTDALDEVLNKKRSVDDDTHKIHHKFIAMEIERRENNKKLWMKFKLSFIGGMALGILGFLGWIGALLVESFKSGNHP